MTTLDATVATAQAGIAAPTHQAVRFLGNAGAFWQLLVRGAVLLMFTLGIYRFWLTTDIRRFLWSNTDLLGQTFEYTGTARELLLGFLIAVAILVPLNTAVFIITLTFGPLGNVAGVVMNLALLTVLGQYAVYRARRYRLTRTIYRGVRFHQTGSAWRYAICAVFWWSLIILTFGLAYPFGQSRLERFKMRHTFFGNLPGHFAGSGGRLFARGVLMWFLAVVPTTVGLVATIAAIDWTTLLAAGRSEDLSGWFEASGVANAVVYAGVTLAWLLLSVAVLYPIFQAMVLRWWTSGLRFGDVAVTSRLRTAQIFGVYGRFLWYAFLFTFVAGVLAVAAAYAIPSVLKQDHSTLSEIIATVALVAAYVIAALGYSTIYQATVRLGLWRCVAESLDISGAAALECVSAAGEPSSPIGEGLADALDIGGI
jgi:uncharacterized membrane protein YjgN (DUF898 family)